MSKDNEQSSRRRNAEFSKKDLEAIKEINNPLRSAPPSAGYGIPKAFKEKEADPKYKIKHDMNQIQGAVKDIKTGVETALSLTNPAAMVGILASKAVGSVVKGIEISGLRPIGIDVAGLREIYQEKKYLDEQKACNAIKAEIINKHGGALKQLPELQDLKSSKGFDNTLMNIKNHENMKQQYQTFNKYRLMTDIAEGIAQEKVIDQSVDAIKETLKSVIESPDPSSIITKLTISGLKASVDLPDKIQEFRDAYNKKIAINDAKIDINNTKGAGLISQNIKPYSDIYELKENAREQKIITSALMRITENEERFNKIKDDPEKLKAAFKKEIAVVEKQFKPIERPGKISEFFKDIARGIEVGGSKYSKDEIEFTDPKKIKEQFEAQGINYTKTSFEKLKEDVTHFFGDAKIQHKEEHHAKLLLKGVNMLYKGEEINKEAKVQSQSHNALTEEFVHNMQKHSNLSEHNSMTPSTSSNTKNTSKTKGQENSR